MRAFHPPLHSSHKPMICATNTNPKMLLTSNSCTPTIITITTKTQTLKCSSSPFLNPPINFGYGLPHLTSQPLKRKLLSPTLALSSAPQGPLVPPSRPRRPAPGHYDDIDTDNVLVYLVKSLLRDVQRGLYFLCEQPGELKYIEFPSIQSAARMALFTLMVVMVLIIFLATVDSAFSYIVAMVFRRTQ